MLACLPVVGLEVRELAKPLLIVEAQFDGFVHATFNSYLVEAAHRAFPERRKVFVAETSHLEEVQHLLRSRLNRDLNGLDFKPIELGAREYPSRRQEFSIAGAIDRLAQVLGAGLILFTSASWTQLIGLCRLRRKQRAVPIVAFLHTHSAGFRVPGMRGALSAVVRRALLERFSPMRGVIVFSESGRRAAHAATRFKRISITKSDPPYGPAFGRVAASRAPSARPTFGWLGNSAKGEFSDFLAAARRLRERSADFSLLLVGCVNRPLDELDSGLFAEQPSERMLSTERYQELMSKITHGVLWSRSEDYEHKISAAFLDAIVQGVPGVYMATPFLRECFARFGDCGILCASTEEMERGMEYICQGRDAGGRDAWSESMRRARAELSPEVVAPQFRALLERYLSAEVSED